MIISSKPVLGMMVLSEEGGSSDRDNAYWQVISFIIIGLIA